MPTLEQFKNARSVLKGVIRETSLIDSPALSKGCGNRVYLKPENMQVTGAYKIRGAYYKISTLTQEQRERGLVTASAGNHAQGVAYAAQAAGVPPPGVGLHGQHDQAEHGMVRRYGQQNMPALSRLAEKLLHTAGAVGGEGGRLFKYAGHPPQCGDLRGVFRPGGADGVGHGAVTPGRMRAILYSST